MTSGLLAIVTSRIARQLRVPGSGRVHPLVEDDVLEVP
jgi:hypothetical protein